MIFSPKIYLPKDIIQMILCGKKTQTRRLAKPFERIVPFSEDEDCVVIAEGLRPQKLKWVVGRDYAVQLGRGKAGLWYCPKCKNEINKCYCKNKGFSVLLTKANYKPLRIEITGLWKEKLLNISEEDAKKEGFENKMCFLASFTEVNKMPWVNLKIMNPDVWVIEFKKKVLK